jgi:hypothetical protein
MEASMFSANPLPPRQLLLQTGDDKTTRRGVLAAAREAADHERVGLSVGGVVLVTAVTIMGGSGIALPFTYDLPGWLGAGCWVVAAFYILLAGHWVRVMLSDGPQPVHAPIPTIASRQ